MGETNAMSNTQAGRIVIFQETAWRLNSTQAKLMPQHTSKLQKARNPKGAKCDSPWNCWITGVGRAVPAMAGGTQCCSVKQKPFGLSLSKPCFMASTLRQAQGERGYPNSIGVEPALQTFVLARPA